MPDTNLVALCSARGGEPPPQTRGPGPQEGVERNGEITERERGKTENGPKDCELVDHPRLPPHQDQ